MTSDAQVEFDEHVTKLLITLADEVKSLRRDVDALKAQQKKDPK